MKDITSFDSQVPLSHRWMSILFILTCHYKQHPHVIGLKAWPPVCKSRDETITLKVSEAQLQTDDLVPIH